MTNKELLERFKDMADCADASYAFLEYVYENEKFDIKDDEFKINKNPNTYLPSRWIYADNITKGWQFNKNTKIQWNGKYIERNKGEPTAYALAIETRFCKDLIIDKPVEDDKTCEI